MPRPSEFNREEAIEAAMNEIWRNGYERSSVKTLSETLGITRSSFYNAFGTREDFFRQVLAVYFAKAPDRILHSETPQISARALFTGLFKELCRVRASDAEGRGCLAINCLCELKGGDHDELGAEIARAALMNVERVNKLLKEAVGAGEFPSEMDTRATALSLQALLFGINAMSKAVRGEEDLWLAAKTALAGLDMYDQTDHR